MHWTIPEGIPCALCHSVLKISLTWIVSKCVSSNMILFPLPAHRSPSTGSQHSTASLPIVSRWGLFSCHVPPTMGSRLSPPRKPYSKYTLIAPCNRHHISHQLTLIHLKHCQATVLQAHIHTTIEVLDTADRRAQWDHTLVAWAQVVPDTEDIHTTQNNGSNTNYMYTE